MILIGALPTVYSALRAAIRREGQSHIVVAQQISPTVSEILSQWTWIAEQLDLSVLMWIFFKLTLVSVPALLYRKDKENVIIGG